MGCGESEEEKEINVQEPEKPKKGGEEGKAGEEEKKQTPKKPAEKKPDNKPYEKMKALANPAAWTAFTTYALHEAPKGAPKSSN
jgi:hypothetical protein